MKDIYWGVQGDFKVALVRNGCLANWLNGLWMDYLVQKECMCKVANDIDEEQEEEELNKPSTWRINKCQKW